MPKKQKPKKKDSFDEIIEDLQKYDEGYIPRKPSEIDE